MRQTWWLVHGPEGWRAYAFVAGTTVAAPEVRATRAEAVADGKRLMVSDQPAPTVQSPVSRGL